MWPGGSGGETLPFKPKSLWLPWGLRLVGPVRWVTVLMRPWCI